VPRSLPTFFFGDLFNAGAAPVGVNPSHRECLGDSGKELAGIARRFETLSWPGAVRATIEQ
jgi:hypothetical protein